MAEDRRSGAELKDEERRLQEPSGIREDDRKGQEIAVMPGTGQRTEVHGRAWKIERSERSGEILGREDWKNGKK